MLLDLLLVLPSGATAVTAGTGAGKVNAAKYPGGAVSPLAVTVPTLEAFVGALDFLIFLTAALGTLFLIFFFFAWALAVVAWYYFFGLFLRPEELEVAIFFIVFVPDILLFLILLDRYTNYLPSSIVTSALDLRATTFFDLLTISL